MGRIFSSVTNETDTFVQEVDESLRQDRMLSLLKRYGPFLAAFVVLVFFGMIGWDFWRNNQEAESDKHSELYLVAQPLLRAPTGEPLAPAQLQLAQGEFERLSGQGPRSYRAMARMQRAALLQQGGELEAALAEFDAAAEQAPDATMKETAQLRAAYIAAEIKDFAELRRRLTPLIGSERRFSFLARELLGVEAWEAGEVTLARETMQGLVLALDAPAGVRERAQLAIAAFGPQPEAETSNPAEGEGK
jgi:hypothetical protein